MIIYLRNGLESGWKSEHFGKVVRYKIYVSNQVFGKNGELSTLI